MKASSELTKTGRILMWKAERMRRVGRKHNTDTGAIKGTEKDRIVGKNRIEGRRTDGNRRRQTENVREQNLRNNNMHREWHG